VAERKENKSIGSMEKGKIERWDRSREKRKWAQKKRMDPSWIFCDRICVIIYVFDLFSISSIIKLSSNLNFSKFRFIPNIILSLFIEI
jgi:hypothetical protein